MTSDINQTQSIQSTHGITIPTLRALELALAATAVFPTKHTIVDAWSVGNHT